MPEARTGEGDRMLDTVADILRRRGAQGWLVGGTVRDRELGRFSPDIDVVVTGDAAGISRELSRLLGLPWFTLSDEHQAYRVVGTDSHLDIAAVRGDILTDLGQRDFTINAMALPVMSAAGDSRETPTRRPDGDNLIDPFHGLQDLRAGRLSAVSDQIFEHDPLRLMRAVRFSRVLGLSIEPRLAVLAKDSAYLLSRAAPERIASEMFLTLADPGHTGDAARLWGELGLLRSLVPEAAEKGRPEPGFLEAVDRIVCDLPRYFPESAQLLNERLGLPVDGAAGRGAALGLAGLVWGIDRAAAAAAGRRLKFSGALLSLLETTARMSQYQNEAGLSCRPDTGLSRREPDADCASAAPGRAAVLFFWDAAPWEPEVILLAAAAGLASDAGATARTATVADGPRPGPGFELARRLMSVWAARQADGAPHLPFDGVTLMDRLRLPAGPELGKALKAARLAWEAGEATSPEQALEAARQALRGR